MAQKTLVDLAEAGQLRALEEHLDAGTPIDARTSDGRVALHAALAEGQEEIARYLLARGADPHLVDVSGYTGLHWASRSNEVAMLELAHDAARQDVDVADLQGRTPLSWVAQGNDLNALGARQGCRPESDRPRRLGALALRCRRRKRRGDRSLGRHFAPDEPHAEIVLEAAEAA